VETLYTQLQTLTADNPSAPREALALLVADLVIDLTTQILQESIDGFYRNNQKIADAVQNKPLCEQLNIAANSVVGHISDSLEAQRGTLYGCPDHSN